MKATDLISPITNIQKSFEMYKNINQDKQSFQQGDLSQLAYYRRKKKNQLEIVKNLAPLTGAILTIGLLSSGHLYDLYQDGVDISNYLHSLTIPLADPLSGLKDSLLSFEPKMLFNDFSQYSQDYVLQVASSAGDLVKTLYKNYFNSGFILSTISSYAAFQGLIKAVDFVSTSTPNLRERRDYDTESLKLEILKQKFQDPVFDSLNNEEIYATMVTFNKSLHDYYNNKNVLVHKATRFISKFGNPIASLFRQTFNSSTNEKNHLINNSIDYLNAEIDINNLSSIYKKYGVSEHEFNVLASNKGGTTLTEKINYIFSTNENALNSAYNLKLKDDTMLAFSLELEKFCKSEEFTPEYTQSFNKILEFRTFLSGFGKTKFLVGDLRMPPELKMMDDIVSKFEKRNQYAIEKIHENKLFKKYSYFISENAPHLIEKNDNEKSIIIKNYTFLNYFESEKHRIVRKDLINRKLNEYEEALSNLNELKDPAKESKIQSKIDNLRKESRALSNIFPYGHSTTNTTNSFINMSNRKISSIYNDKILDSKVSVMNLLSEKEDLLMGGTGYSNLGLDYEDVDKALRIKQGLQATDDVSLDRKSFKNKGCKFKI